MEVLNNVYKTYIPSDAHLARELADLRKGIGLTPAKLTDKPALRSLVARHMNLPLASITNGQIYAFLVTEIAKIAATRNGQALYNAFGLVEESKETLSERRALLAKKVHKHPDTVERYENQGVIAFIAHLSDLQPMQALPFSSIAHLQHLEEQAQKSRQATTLGLSGLLSLDDRAEELVDFLESSPRPYLDASIDINFGPSKRGDNWYSMVVAYTFRGKRETFRFAVVTVNEDGERLMKLGLVDEFHQLNNTIEPTREIRALVNSAKLTLRHKHSDQQKLLRLRLLSPEQTKPLLQSVDEPMQGSCRILEVTIPHEWRTPETIYEYYSAINLRDDTHYAYWYAPSLMYVKRLTFDYSKFPNADRWQFMALPFLGHIAGDVLDRNRRSFVLHPNSWIMPGHGIGLTWE